MEGLERGPVLAKQVLSQLSYTPTKTTLILNHSLPFRIPILRKIVFTVPNRLQSNCLCLCQILCQMAFLSRSLAVTALQGFSLPLQLHVRIFLEDLRVALSK